MAYEGYPVQDLWEGMEEVATLPALTPYDRDEAVASTPTEGILDTMTEKRVPAVQTMRGQRCTPIPCGYSDRMVDDSPVRLNGLEQALGLDADEFFSRQDPSADARRDAANLGHIFIG
jgi:hypothetical protein